AKGTVRGEPPDKVVAVDVHGQSIVLDQELLHALPSEYQPLAQSFHASGKGDFKAYIRRGPDKATRKEKSANRYVVQFHDAAVRYEVFPYPLERVSGILDIQPDHWEYRDFRGIHGNAEFRTSGRSLEGDRVKIEIHGKGFSFDDDLHAAIA